MNSILLPVTLSLEMLDTTLNKHVLWYKRCCVLRYKVYSFHLVLTYQQIRIQAFRKFDTNAISQNKKNLLFVSMYLFLGVVPRPQDVHAHRGCSIFAVYLAACRGGRESELRKIGSFERKIGNFKELASIFFCAHQ